MKEQLITFDTAKLAKEKGFDIPVRFGYMSWRDKTIEYPIDMMNYFISYGNSDDSDGSIYKGENFNLLKGNTINVSVPTQSLLQRWIREKYNIHIKIDNVLVGIHSIKFRLEVYDVNNHAILRHDTISDVMFDTYEEALEVGLFEALKLIKND